MLEIIAELLKLTVFAGLALAGMLVIVIWKQDLKMKISYLRLFVQLIALIAIYYMYTYSLWLLLMITIILVLPLFLGRFFCGWLCPFGFYSDLITILRKSSKVRYRLLPDRLNKILNQLRYVIFVFFLVLPFLLGPIESWQWFLGLFLSGPFRSMSVLIGPLEPLIIPWETGIKLFDINISYPYVTDIIFWSGDSFIFTVSVFVALTLVASFFIRRFWCRFCPTGVSIAIINRVKGFRWAPLLHLNKDEEKCTKCGICKRVCPLQVTEVYDQKGGNITTSMCMLCVRCIEMCPYKDCLKLRVGKKAVFKSRDWL
ncbi:4Fe-4S binding protein [Thermoproteota archaeon]